VTAFGEITPPDFLGELPRPRAQLRRKPRFSRDKDGRLEGYPKVVVGERSAPASGSSSAIAQPGDSPGKEAQRPQPTSCDPAEQTSGDESSSQDTVPLLRGGAGPSDGRVPRVLWFTAGGMGRRPIMPEINLSSEERENVVRGGLMGLLFGGLRRSSTSGSDQGKPEESRKGEAAGADARADGGAVADAVAPAADGDPPATSGALPAP